MGYYTGSGVVSNGGSNVTLRSTGPAVGGAIYTFQRITSTVTIKNGVSLAVAQAASGDMNLGYWTWPNGAIEPACKGSRSFASYSQINGSNLYMLQTTEETIQIRAKQGSYDSGWQS